MAATIGDVIGQLEECLGADFSVTSDKRWKFTADFRGDVQNAFDELVATNEDIPGGEAARRDASEQLKQDYPVAETMIHSVYNRIKGLSLTGDSLPLLVAYGFESGKLGNFDQSRVRKTPGQFITTSADFANAANPNHNAEAVLPAAWITQITALKTRIVANELLSSLGPRGTLVDLRDTKLKAANDVLSRIWHYLAYALPQRDQDPLMNNYGFQPRQDATHKKAAPPPPTPPTP